MPNRILREKSLTSPTLAKLSDAGERLFWRLIAVADDHGRFEAEADVVRSACFPKLLSKFSITRVERLLRDLDAAGLIQLYHVKDRTYGAFLTWKDYQRVRAETSKFPAPDCGHPQTSADIGGQARTSAPVVGNRSRESRVVVGNRESDHAAFSRWWAAYPRKVGKADALKAWLKLKPDPAVQTTILEAVARQRTWPQWVKNGGQFIPHPATWLNGRRWEDEEPSAPRERSIADDLTPQQRDKLKALTAGIGKPA